MQEIYFPKEDSYLLSKIILEKFPKFLSKNPNLIFLEIGCGSGVQLKTAFKTGLAKQNIFSCDINIKAVKHCKKLGFNCVQSDLFSNIKGKFDIIIFNPPYLPEDKKEPKNSRLATTGGKKGSEIINRFLKNAKKHLKKNTKIFLITSSLTQGINWQNYQKKLLGKKKLFFERLYIFEISEKNFFDERFHEGQI